ncbi:MAG: tyrosine-type recombinase/integrase [Acidimicrobiales bacterium]
MLDPLTGARVSLGTFPTRAEAHRNVNLVLADQSRGSWVDPAGGRERLSSYATAWVSDHPKLRPRTRRFYQDLLRLHILPSIGNVEIGRLTPRQIRTWYSRLAGESGPGSSTAAKAYRLLHAIMATATADELVAKNPCMLANAGREHPAERPVVTVAQVFELAGAVDRHFRLLVLMAAFTGLRRSELFGLARRHLDLLHGTISVVQQRQRMPDGSIAINPPKTQAGIRTIAIPPPLIPEIQAHLSEFAAPGVDGLVFLGVKGGPLREHVWQKKWDIARRSVGLPELHFHDLRHVANTLAASTGASLRELMHRMGHASPAAALRYQHATRERDAAIAAALGALIVPAPDSSGGAAVVSVSRRS